MASGRSGPRPDPPLLVSLPPLTAILAGAAVRAEDALASRTTVRPEWAGIAATVFHLPLGEQKARGDAHRGHAEFRTA